MATAPLPTGHPCRMSGRFSRWVWAGLGQERASTRPAMISQRCVHSGFASAQGLAQKHCPPKAVVRTGRSKGVPALAPIGTACAGVAGQALGIGAGALAVRFQRRRQHLIAAQPVAGRPQRRTQRFRGGVMFLAHHAARFRRGMGQQPHHPRHPQADYHLRFKPDPCHFGPQRDRRVAEGNGGKRDSCHLGSRR